MNKVFSFYSERTNANLNDLNSNGVFICTGSCSNSPSGTGAWFVFVFGNTNKYFVQLAYPINDNNSTLRYRACNNGTFSSWKSV